MHKRLKSAREAAGFNKATDAAKHFGWPIPTYLSNENGNRTFSSRAGKRYADAFNVDFGWLMTGEQFSPTRQLAETTAKYEPAVQNEPNIISFAMSPRDIEDARELGVDIESVAREAAAAAVKAKLAAEFKRQSAAGIAASNAWMAEHGTLAEQTGMIEDDDGAV